MCEFKRVEIKQVCLQVEENGSVFIERERERERDNQMEYMLKRGRELEKKTKPERNKEKRKGKTGCRENGKWQLKTKNPGRNKTRVCLQVFVCV